MIVIAVVVWDGLQMYKQDGLQISKQRLDEIYEQICRNVLADDIIVSNARECSTNAQ